MCPWKGVLSRSFCVQSGVRQGSSMSPGVFNICINIFITELKKLNYGCTLNNVYVGVLLYADDVILLSASLHGLQKMLNCCEAISSGTLLEFNIKKCSCSVIGPAASSSIANLKLWQADVEWSSHFKYLGVTFIARKKLSVDINIIKRKFFAACNCILGNVKCLEDILKLSLMESFCLPILQYSIVAFDLSAVQISELNASWNSVYRKIFGFNKW